MTGTAVLGTGHYLPPLVERLGVTRPIEVVPPGTSELGARAGRAALASAGLSASDLDFLVFATINPDVTFPGSACFLQEKLECDTVGALDIRAQCAGFVFALSVAEQFVRCGVYRRVLVVGGELHSVWVDYSSGGAELARRFGDGAGALVLGPGDGGTGVLGTVLHTDGSRYDRFWCEYPASRHHPLRIGPEDIREGRHYPKMQEEEVRRFGSTALPQVIREAAERASIDLARVDRFVIAHVFPDVAQRAGKELGVEERVVNPSDRYGHLGAAALPLALSIEISEGRIGSGDLVCLAAAGAGFAWGAALLRL